MADTIEYTVLHCGRTVPTWLYKSLLAHVLKRADELEPCRPYNLRRICGHQYWSGLRGFKTFAGIIMAELVDLQLVPYQFASDRDEKPLWYCLAP
jgi:hypothetical protein